MGTVMKKIFIFITLLTILQCSLIQKKDTPVKKIPEKQIEKYHLSRIVLKKIRTLIGGHSRVNRMPSKFENKKEHNKRDLNYVKYHIRKVENGITIDITFNIITYKGNDSYHVIISTEGYKRNNYISEDIELRVPDKQEFLKKLEEALKKVM